MVLDWHLYVAITLTTILTSPNSFVMTLNRLGFATKNFNFIVHRTGTTLASLPPHSTFSLMECIQRLARIMCRSYRSSAPLAKVRMLAQSPRSSLGSGLLCHLLYNLLSILRCFTACLPRVLIASRANWHLNRFQIPRLPQTLSLHHSRSIIIPPPKPSLKDPPPHNHKPHSRHLLRMRTDKAPDPGAEANEDFRKIEDRIMRRDRRTGFDPPDMLEGEGIYQITNFSCNEEERSQGRSNPSVIGGIMPIFPLAQQCHA